VSGRAPRLFHMRCGNSTDLERIWFGPTVTDESAAGCLRLQGENEGRSRHLAGPLLFGEEPCRRKASGAKLKPI